MDGKKVQAAIKYGGLTVNKISGLFPYTRQALTGKINRGTLTESELKIIANAIGAEYIPAKFKFNDGTII